MPPVETHEVHESTKIDSNTRYGCHNRKPLKKSYFAPNRFLPVLRDPKDFFKQMFQFHAKQIEHRMSIDCRYDMSLTDARCTNCKHQGSGEAYNQIVRSKGT